MRACLIGWLATGALLCGGVAEFPLRQAREARIELRAAPEVGDLVGAEVVSPLGRLEVRSAVQDGQTGRVCVAQMPVVPFSWTPLSLTFMPERDGQITLTLTGPRQTGTNGAVFRQEVAFDGVRLVGASLTNGGFELYVGNRPVGWEGGGVANAGPLPPVEGANYARVWAERPLRQTVQVRGGTPVTLHLTARAMPVLGPETMKPLAERNTLAHQSAAYYRRGINAGNFLEVPPKQTWAVEHSEEDFRNMKREGFDHVRIPVGWHHYTGPAPQFAIAPEFFQRVDTVVSNALRQGLFVIINIHHFDEFTSQPAAHSNKFLAIWRQLAEHYAEAHPGLAFELLNEPKDAATTEVMNPLYAQALKIIRARNPLRTVFLGPGRWNSIEELVHLWLPPEEDNVIVTVHNYEPFYFTHQSASWAGEDVRRLKGIVFPGPPPAPLEIPDGVKPWVRDWLVKYNTRPTAINPCSRAILELRLKMAKDWSDFYGRPVHVGEFGAYQAADTLSRTRYCRDFRLIAEGHGLGWAMWAWQAGFSYWDRQRQTPVPGMREALFFK